MMTLKIHFIVGPATHTRLKYSRLHIQSLCALTDQSTYVSGFLVPFCLNTSLEEGLVLIGKETNSTVISLTMGQGDSRIRGVCVGGVLLRSCFV